MKSKCSVLEEEEADEDCVLSAEELYAQPKAEVDAVEWTEDESSSSARAEAVECKTDTGLTVVETDLLNGAEIRHVSAAKGRGLLATCDVSAGHCVLEESAIVSVIRMKERCAHCWRLCAQPTAKRRVASHASKPKPLRRCSKCKLTHYCSKRCQVADWRLGHALRCAALCKLTAVKSVNESVIGIAEMALISAAINAGLKTQSHFTEAQSQLLCSLQSESSADSAAIGGDTDEDSATRSLVLGECVSQYLRNCDCCKLFSEMTQSQTDAMDAMLKDKAFARMCVAKWSRNAVTVCDIEQRAAGIGLFPICAMANHSCDQNAMLSFASGNWQKAAGKNASAALRLVTTRPLKKGEEVCISYCSVTQATTQRMRYLRKNYWFACHCPVCDCTEPRFETREKEMGKVKKESIETSAALKALFGVDKAQSCDVSKLKTAYARVKDSIGAFHNAHWHFHNLWQSVALKKSMWFEALEPTLECVVFLEWFHCEKPRKCSVHCAATGKLAVGKCEHSQVSMQLALFCLRLAKLIRHLFDTGFGKQLCVAFATDIRTVVCTAMRCAQKTATVFETLRLEESTEVKEQLFAVLRELQTIIEGIQRASV